MMVGEDCSCNFRTWQPAKPRMDQKMTHHLQNDSLEIGLKETFTEDGWVSRKYVLSSMLLDCYLFTHPQHETLIFKKVGGPIVTLHLGEVVDFNDLVPGRFFTRLSHQCYMISQDLEYLMS